MNNELPDVVVSMGDLTYTISASRAAENAHAIAAEAAHGARWLIERVLADRAAAGAMQAETNR